MEETNAAPALRTNQLSLAAILSIVSLYAFWLGLAVLFSLPAVQVTTALLVLTLFVALDFSFRRVTQESRSRWGRLMLFVACYATAFSYSAAACLLVFMINLESHVSMPSQTPGFAAFRAGFRELLRLYFLVFLYFGMFFVSNLAGTIASVIIIRRSRLAFWLLLLNLPGIALLSFSIISALHQN